MENPSELLPDISNATDYPHKFQPRNQPSKKERRFKACKRAVVSKSDSSPLTFDVNTTAGSKIKITIQTKSKAEPERVAQKRKPLMKDREIKSKRRTEPESLSDEWPDHV